MCIRWLINVSVLFCVCVCVWFIYIYIYIYMPLNIDLLTFRLVFFVFTLGVYVSED